MGGWSTPRPGRFTPQETDPVPIVQEAGLAPGTVCTGAENIASTDIRSPDRPARTQSLHRLSYPGPHFYIEAQLLPSSCLYQNFSTSKHARSIQSFQGSWRLEMSKNSQLKFQSQFNPNVFHTHKLFTGISSRTITELPGSTPACPVISVYL
jgi:hypothetical protein